MKIKEAVEIANIAQAIEYIDGLLKQHRDNIMDEHYPKGMDLLYGINNSGTPVRIFKISGISVTESKEGLIDDIDVSDRSNRNEEIEELLDHLSGTVILELRKYRQELIEAIANNQLTTE